MTAQVPEYGGCVWPVDSACFTTEWDALDPEVKDRALALASSTLHRLTGGRVSNCPITVRPCRPESIGAPVTYGGSRYWAGAMFPIMWDGEWRNVCRGPGMGCAVEEVALPAPVGRVDEVKVDGQVIPPGDYRIDNSRLLVWQGLGSVAWPKTQDLSKPDTEPDTFSVTYLNAYPVDSLGAYAAGVMAMEYARACNGSKCRLPAGVTQVARRGVTMEIASGAFPNGLTGIREVDAFIALWNPRGLQRGSAVWSPDGTNTRLTTGG